jgi:peptidoglycan/xylan/chitin deacetylase (PgdA/CDA1 family)
MADDPLVRFTLADAGGAAHLAWAEGTSCAWPLSVLEATGLGRHLGGDGKLRLPARPQGPDPAAAPALRLRAAFTDVPPLTSRLPLSYRLVPGWLRAGLAGLLGRWQRRRPDRWARFPGWPLDLSADLLADLVRGPSGGPPPGPTPVLLTHDLDSPEGTERLLAQFLPLEEAAGARSLNFVVPCAWPLDRGRLDEVRARGHEVGVHGYDHSNRTANAAPDERRRRLEAGKAALAGYDVRGYRAPSLVRTAPLLRDLAGLYRFDSSIPTSGGPFPTPNNGCASARPFAVEGLCEIPLSLPRDGSLRFLGYRPAEIAALWIDCAERIARSGGVVVLLTHCEARFSGNGPMQAAYRVFLDHVAGSGRFRWAGAAEVLRATGPDPYAGQVPA